MRAILPVLVGVVVAWLCSETAVAQPEHRDLYADTWVATDALGRHLPGYAEVGPPRENKAVGIFYWTWHTQHAKATGQNVYDVTEIIAANPEKPEWSGSVGMPHHWGRPEMGYYIATDPYVLRKHALMLDQAGVDVLFFDTTNPPFTFKESYMALCEVFTQMAHEGHKVPRIVFICPFGNPMPVLERIYADLYQPGLFEPLWFRWQEKPLVLADPSYVTDPEMKAFFTFRRPMPTYFDGPSGPNQWGWLEVFPQHAFYGDTPEDIEQVTVGVAQNAAHGKLAPMSHRDGAYGRSWRQGRRDPAPDAVLYGFNFQEQFERALEIDPPFIFITGWNEWLAGRFVQWAWYHAPEHSYYPDAMFVDQFTQEYSRDIEPMAGGHTDNYYYQLVANIRRFKGIRRPPEAGEPVTITIDGQFGDWDAVEPEYRDALGDTAHRDHPGFGGQHYTNTSGRNDLATMKVARDAHHVYFYAETADPLTPHQDANWMLLFLDIDQDHDTGWEGYDYVVNLAADEQTTSLHRLTDGWNPEHVTTIPYAVEGNRLELAIPRTTLGLTPDCQVALDFKWADNIQTLGDVKAFFLDGDVAPDRRFNYRHGQRSPRDGD
jgi:hypothetical protein